MNTTTDLIAVRERPGLFTWGTIRKIHDIGPYTLIEYPCIVVYIRSR
jgi:hypothetical protein